MLLLFGTAHTINGFDYTRPYATKLIRLNSEFLFNSTFYMKAVNLINYLIFMKLHLLFNALVRAFGTVCFAVRREVRPFLVKIMLSMLGPYQTPIISRPYIVGTGASDAAQRLTPSHITMAFMSMSQHPWLTQKLSREAQNDHYHHYHDSHCSYEMFLMSRFHYL